MTIRVDTSYYIQPKYTEAEDLIRDLGLDTKVLDTWNNEVMVLVGRWSKTMVQCMTKDGEIKKAKVSRLIELPVPASRLQEGIINSIDRYEELRNTVVNHKPGGNLGYNDLNAISSLIIQKLGELHVQFEELTGKKYPWNLAGKKW